jgi:hypothetical protein
MSAIAGFLTTPDGVKVVVVAACHCGGIDEGEQALRPLREFGPPVLDEIGPVPYTAFQQALDANFPRGRRYYWKSTLVRELSDDAISQLIELFDSVPSAMTAILLQQLGNAANRVPPAATAFANRDARWDGVLLTSWEDAAQDATQIEWTREAWRSLRPFSTGGVYVNGVADGDAEEISGAFGSHYARLAELKAKYDPTNLFRVNANITPKADREPPLSACASSAIDKITAVSGLLRRATRSSRRKPRCEPSPSGAWAERTDAKPQLAEQN